MQQDVESLGIAKYGFKLSVEEQKRRYLIKSILHQSGINPMTFENQFKEDLTDTFPELDVLSELGYLEKNSSAWKLTSAGMAQSDAIGPALYSETVCNLIEGYELL